MTLGAAGSKGVAKAMKKVAPSEVKDDLSKYLEFENDPRFLERIQQARQSLRNSKGVKLEEVAPPKQRRTKR